MRTAQQGSLALDRFANSAAAGRMFGCLVGLFFFVVERGLIGEEIWGKNKEPLKNMKLSSSPRAGALRLCDLQLIKNEGSKRLLEVPGWF